jgi:uncharacterized repeat protein (TIGR01451 family)
MKKRRGLDDRGFSRKSRRQSRPTLERFEDRLLLTVFTVTSTADTGANATAGDGSLRGEILASNASTTALPNVIDFALPAGVQTISVVSALTTITEPVTIDGSTATGFTTQPLIQISGSTIQGGLPVNGLTTNIGGVVIKDLIIDGFSGDGISLGGAGSDQVTGSYIGTNAAGTAIDANAGVGILVSSPNNQIGNPSGTPNIVSGNNVGIQITGTGDNNNVVSNNFVGTDVTGSVALGNTDFGIEVNTGATSNGFGGITQFGNTIGGLTSGGTLGGNLISGNAAGLDISGTSANSNVVEGNFIGTDITGLKPVPNVNDGIDLNDVNLTSIGSTVAGSGNVISGNRGNGIQVTGTSILNRIVGNDIGVGRDGVTAVGNSDSGVVINGANENTVGGTSLTGTSPQFANIIANNGIGSPNNYGVEILGGANNGILSNSIYNNGGLGIKLSGGNSGVTPPTLISSESGAGQTEITGSYTGISGDTYDIQFFANQTPNPSGAGDGQTFLGDFPITTNNQGVATFTTILDQAVPVGDFVSATATDGVLSTNNTSQFATNVENTQAPVTDLQVTTSVPATPPLFDQPYIYTLTVTNNGPNDDTGVVLTDTIPTGSTFVRSSAGTETGGVLTDNIGDLADGASEVVTITVNPTSLTGTFTNTASVTGNGLDPNLLNNTSTTTGTVEADSDLAILITPAFTGTEIPIGTAATYAITVSNFGPSSSTGVVTTISLPSSFTDVTVVPDEGTFTIDANNNITVDTGLLGVSSSSTILVTATPEATGTAVVSASVTSDQIDPNTSNNSASNSVTVANAADLAIGIDATPDPVLIGNELIYTLTVTNNGPSAASEPVVSDPLPAGLTYVPGDSSAGPNGTLSFADGVVTANMNALLAGDTDTITIAVIPTVSGQVTNTVTVADPTLANPVEIDTNLDNNTASFTTQVSPADLAVTIDNPADPLFIGSQAVFQIVITNNGPATATDVLLNDTFGSGATILSTSAGTISGSTVSGNLGTLASGASETVTITIDPTVSGTLLDSASVSSDEFDPDPNNNSASSSNLVSPVDLSVAVTPSVSTIQIGQSLTYTIQVANAGPATATNVIFTDDLPANFTISSITSSQGALTSSGSTISGNIGSLASGGSATITIVVTPTVVETAVNTATVTSDDLDTNPSNNTVTTTINAINSPGTLQFGSSIELVPENAGFITLTVDRTIGTLGAVTVDYATSDFTAVAGVNYVATSGTISFADGQTSATIMIPVLNDGIVDGPNTGFFVTLSNPTGGAVLGAGSVSAVLVTNTDFDTIPPDVSSLIGIPSGNSLNGFIVTFDKQMALNTIADLTNYHVFKVASNGSQTPVPLAGVEYNLSTFAVTIVPTNPLPANTFYRIVLNGSSGDVLTDTSGNILFGSSGPNTNYDVIYGQGTNLTYDDALGNRVNIKMSGGGSLGIYLASNGQADAVDLYGVVPRKTKLSGSVTKLSRQSSGFTTIGTIDGFGAFGDVFSTLTTPPFYVGSAPVSTTSVSASSTDQTVNALSISTSTISTTVKKTMTMKSRTPKGPKVKLV